MKVFKSQLNQLASHLKQLKDEDGLNPLRQNILQQQLLSRLLKADKNINVPKRYLWARHRFSYAYVLTAALLVVLLTSGTVFAAQGALPGDTLYPVKRLTEKVEVTLATSEKVKANIEATHAIERLNEVLALQQKALEQVEEASRVKLEQREVEAREHTENEVETALNVLRELQIKFETSGKNQDASILNNALEQLTKKASESEYEVRYEGDHGRYKVKNNKNRKSEDNKERNNKNESNNNSSSPDSNSSVNVPTDARENSDKVFCYGEWRKLGDCEVENPPTTNTNPALPDTPLPDAGNSPSSADDSSTDIDIKEGNDEVFCRGEWRDPEDCN